MALGEIDYSKKPNKLNLYLCKPDLNRTTVAKLNHAYNEKLNTKHGKIFTLNFSYPFENEINHKLIRERDVDKIKKHYLIRAEYGNSTTWFIIDKKPKKVSDNVDELQISARSLGYELTFKRIRGYKVTSYNCTQVLTDVLDGTKWAVGYINPKFNNMYREFNESSTNALNFVFKIAETFGGIIHFDTVNRAINIYDKLENAEDKGLRVKYGHYLQSLNEEEESNEFATRLYVYGRNDLSIQEINPSGQPYIDDFSYFKNDDYMSSGLQTSIDNYNTLLESKKPIEETAEIGTTETNITISSHGLVTGDYIVNSSRRELDGTDYINPSRKVTVVDVNNITVESISGQTDGDIIDLFSEGTFGKLFYEKEDLEKTKTTKENELFNLLVDKERVLDNIYVQKENDTYTEHVFTYSGSTTTKTTTLENTKNYAIMAKVSDTNNLTVKLDGTTVSMTANTWKVLGKLTSMTSTSVELSGTSTNIDVRIELVEITQTEHDTTGNESDIIEKYNVDNKEMQINSKQGEIDSTQTDIDNKQIEINNLRTELSYESNFTASEIEELKQFTIGTEWVDQNYTSAKDLYKDALEKFKEFNTPPILLNINIINLLEIVEEQRNWDKLMLGDYIRVKHEKLNIEFKVQIVEIEYDFEAGNINLKISNLQDLRDTKQRLLDSIKQVKETKNDLQQNRYDWDEIGVNFNNRNDRISVKPANPIIANNGNTIDHVENTDGSVDISFEWGFNPSNSTDDQYKIDGFVVYVFSDNKSQPYTFGSKIAKEQVSTLNAERRAFILHGVPANRYFTFGIQAYRSVDDDIDSNGVLKSDIVKSTHSAENPYLPNANVAFTGDIQGTINGTESATVRDNANNAWSKFSGVDNTLPSGNVAFNFAGSSSKGGNALDTDKVNGVESTTITSDIQTALTNAESAQDTADGKITSYYDTTAPASANEGDLWFDTDDGNKIYTYRSGIWTDSQDSKIGQALNDASDAQATADKKVQTFFTPTEPTAESIGDLWYNTSSYDFKRWDGSIWNLVSDVTSQKTSNNTDNVGTQSASTVQDATVNFNNRNDRKSTTPANPSILTDGTAIDHTINTDGSADISFEWSFSGTGDAYDIDGFIVYINQSTSSSAYTFGSNVANEQVFYVTPEKRAFILYGVPSNKYYSFAVQAYRIVDQDVNSAGVIKSDIIKATGTGENPYQPSSSVAFTGDVTGTIAGSSATTVKNNANNSVQQDASYNNVKINSTNGVVVTNQDATTTKMNGDGVEVRGGNITIYDEQDRLVMDGRGLNPLETSGWGVTTGLTFGVNEFTSNGYIEIQSLQTVAYTTATPFTLQLNDVSQLGTSGTIYKLGTWGNNLTYDSVNTVNKTINVSSWSNFDINNGDYLHVSKVDGVSKPAPGGTAKLAIANGSAILKNGKYVKFESTGVSDPSTSPSSSSPANASSTIEQGDYWITYTWVTDKGETTPSPIKYDYIGTGEEMSVTVPSFPSGVTASNIYVSAKNSENGSKWYQSQITTSGGSVSLTSLSYDGNTEPSRNTTDSILFDVPVSVGFTDYDGWQYRVLYISGDGQLAYASAGTSGAVYDHTRLNNYPEHPRYTSLSGSTTTTPDPNCIVLGVILCGSNATRPFDNYIFMHPDFRDDRAVKVDTDIYSLPQYYSDNDKVEKSIFSSSTVSYGDWAMSGKYMTSGEEFEIALPIGQGKKLSVVSVSSVATSDGQDNNGNNGAVMFVGLRDPYTYAWQPRMSIGYSNYFIDNYHSDSYGQYIVHQTSLSWTYRRIKDAYLQIGADGETYLHIIIHQTTGSETRDMRFTWYSM